MKTKKKRNTKPVSPELKAQIIEAFHAGMSWSEMGRTFGRHQSTIAYQLRGQKRNKTKPSAVVKVSSRAVGEPVSQTVTAPPAVVDALSVFVEALAGTQVSTVYVDMEKREAVVECKRVETISFS